MKCKLCGYNTKVVDTRLKYDNLETHRRLECLKCKYRFNTSEIDSSVLKELKIEVKTNQKQIENLKYKCERVQTHNSSLVRTINRQKKEAKN